MGWTSEMVARDFQVSREKQDQYALISHQRAEKVIILNFVFLFSYVVDIRFTDRH